MPWTWTWTNTERGRVRPDRVQHHLLDAVGIRICETAAEQAVTMARGTRRLLRLTVPSARRWVTGQLGLQLTLALSSAPHETLEAAIDKAIAEIDSGLGMTSEEARHFLMEGMDATDNQPTS